MQVSEFLECLDKLTFVEVGRLTYFPEQHELYNPETGSSKYFESHDEFLDANIDGRTVRDIIEDGSYKMLVEIEGGRGSSSESGQTFKFNHASGGGGRGDVGKARFPAEFNDGDKFQSEMKALDKFRERHANSDHEYAIAVDEDGYVHQYIEGGSTSVAITGRDGQLIIHNHPSGGNFSDSDLLSVAQTRGERGIVASGTKGDYIFKKGKNFDGAAFAKAVKRARMKGKDYDDATHKWLTANQKKFGYTYEFRKAKQAGKSDKKAKARAEIERLESEIKRLESKSGTVRGQGINKFISSSSQSMRDKQRIQTIRASIKDIKEMYGL